MKNNKVRKLIILLIFLMVLITFNEIRSAYGLFESEKSLVVTKSIAKWNITINDIDVRTSEDFVIDSFNVENNASVKDGKIAPGSSGYFDIIIDPEDTQVSFRYDLSFDFSGLNDNIHIESIEETLGNDIIRTGEYTYSNVFSLEDIEDGLTNSIRVYIKWENVETENDSDTIIGLTENNILDIGANININQYFGEAIIPYVEQE